ncbi:hypothetical protein GW17_00054490 [Ensete ventricosum]|nr:hypothetical protein GW17_00054490 [Ensete ventricosum]
MVDQYTGKTVLRHRNNAYHLVRLLPTIPDLLGGYSNTDVNLLVGSKKERLDVKVAVSNSFGFGGHNSSILLAPYKQ